METHVHRDKRTTSEAAADRAAALLEAAIDRRGEATFVVATGASQFDFLDALTDDDRVDWARTEMFHLDEYVGLPASHPASFRNYLRQRLLGEVTPGTVHWCVGDAADPRAECERLNALLDGRTLDVAFVGIGENGHLAFNDPPADFETTDPFLLVDLDEKCRKQQVGEGWFDGVADVPERAISMSVRQILAAESVVCTIPGERKAPAVRDCFGREGVSPDRPASILKRHDDADVYLDEESASLLER
jgi:glucosamine-6-phosphate deaminase